MPTIYKNGLVYGGAAGSANLIQATDAAGNASNVQAELDKFNVIDLNSAINHNNIYRGIMLVDTVENTGKYTLAQLHNMVSAGDFSDIYIGDIIKVNMAAVTYTPDGGSSTTDPAQDVEWIVMGINSFLGTGWPTTITSNHLVLVPKNQFNTLVHMNSTNTTVGGYKGSDMFLNILPAYGNAISTSLGNYLIAHQELLSARINDTAAPNGDSTQQGRTTYAQWTNVTVSLLTETAVIGTTVLASSIWDVGEKNFQLPGFRLNPQLKKKGSQVWWTRTVYNKGSFCYIGDGDCNSAMANGNFGLVPIVYFG